jgi:uncharacterized damage-inducible protein DinB
MQASAIEHAQRDDNTLTAPDLILAYEKGVEELRLAVAGLTGEQLRSRPVAGKWSTLEVVCHIADCEQFFADRLKRTVAMDRPLLLGADGFRYPEPLRYQDHDLDLELDLVAVTRRQMARTLRLVAADAWQRTAVHSETGLVTLRQLLLHAVNHLRHHLRFVAEKRAALGSP